MTYPEQNSSGYPHGWTISDNDSSSKPVPSPWEEIRELKRRLNYNGHYIAFLLGMVSKKEFERVSTLFMENRENELEE